MKKLLQSQSGKVETGFWLLNPDNIYFLILLLLPVQIGRHFWPIFSYVNGIRIDYLSPTLYLTDVLIISLFVFWIISKKKEIKKIFRKTNKKFLFFLLFLLLGVVFSKSIPLGIYGLLKFVEFSFFAFYTSINIKKHSQFIKAVKFLSVGVLFESFLSIAQYFHQGSLSGIFYFFGERFYISSTPRIANASLNGVLVLRPYGTFSHPNVLAGFLVIFMSILLFALDFKKLKSMSYFFCLTLFVSTIALLLTLSRVSIVVFLMVFLFYFIRKIKTNRKSFFIFALLFVVTVLGLSLSPLRPRFLDIGLGDQSVSQRLELTKSAYDMFVKNPTFGVGINNFLPNLPSYQKPASLSFFLQPVHNIFLLILSQTGIVGFLFFAWFIKKTLVKIGRTNPKIKLLLFVLIYEIFVLGLFDHYFLTLQQGQLILSFVLGISWTKIKS